MKKMLLLAFVAMSLFAGYWSLHLVDMHYAAAAHLLQPGVLCGQDGGCMNIMGSEWAEILGIPVSLPAIGMYLLLAALGLGALAGKVSGDRVASLATLSGWLGLLFGLFLLYLMLFEIEDLCPYCLILDASNVGVLLLGATLHSGGLKAGLLSAGDVFSRLGQDRRDLLFVALLVVVSGGLQVALHQDTAALQAEANRLAAAAAAAATPTPAPTQSTAKGATASKTPSSAATTAGGKPSPTTRRLVLPEEVHTFNLSDDVPQKGSKHPKVDIVVFEDFQCPFCKKSAGNIDILLEELEVPARVSFMHFPMHKACNGVDLKRNLHKYACAASAAAVCADEQGKFWEMHDLLFRNNTHLRSRDLVRYGKELGLDASALKTCMRSPETLAKLKRDSVQGGDAGVTGTPAMFINGRKLVGAQPVESMKAAVEALLTEDQQGRILLDVELAGEVEGEPATGPTTVRLQGPDGPFTIDAFEASIVDDKAVSKAGAESARGVTWYEAKAACEAADKRLCTEGEWLSACIGEVAVDPNGDGRFSKDPQGGRQHSYGEHWREGWCADSRRKDDPRPLITGTHPQCRTPTGVYDLEGLTKEWVGLTPDRAWLKGGSYFSGSSARCAYVKDSESPEIEDTSVGFRCCSGGAGGDTSGASERYPGGKVGDIALDWTLPRVGGGTLGTKDLKGRPYVITFWASWCEPCKEELPALAQFYEQYKSQGLQVVGINVDSDKSAALGYLKANPLPFPVVLDPDKGVMSRFDGKGTPTTFWVTREGRIRQRSVGYDDKARPKLLRWINELLAAD